MYLQLYRYAISVYIPRRQHCQLMVNRFLWDVRADDSEWVNKIPPCLIAARPAVVQSHENV